MKKTAFLMLFAAVLSFGAAAQVNESELKSTGTDTIEFINYTGPHKVIDSVASIKGIGSSMGRTIRADTASTTGNRNKYYVVHAVDDTQGKLDADILFLGSDAGVDHITNLRRIISAYLSAAYGYSERDADAIAVFVTVYNAVYRGKFDTFQSKYKDIVIRNLSSANCGLSVNYQDWPGKSEIVIPLYDVKNGGLSTVDTSVISDSKVVDSMKEDDDKNIESRKDMVDIKEREAEEAQEKADEAQKKADEEKQKLEEEKRKSEEAQAKADEAQKEADEKQKAADEAQKEADEKQKAADENPDDEQAQEDAARAQEDADKAQQEADEAQQEADDAQQEADEQKEAEQEQQQKADDAQDEADSQQARADQKSDEAAQERKDIAKDQQEVQDKEAAEASMPSEYGIILSDEAQLLSKIVKFNTKTGETIRNSPVTSIRNRTMYKADDGFIAISGENGKNGVIKLVLIDTDTMEMTGESENEVAADSVLVQDGSDYYCVIDDGGKWVIGKYDGSLNLKLRSEIEVKSSTPITVTGSGIVVTNASGALRLLSKGDLKEIHE